MLFEWDEEKNRANVIKHKIDFETAALVFGDENRIEFYDEKHSEFEDRYRTVGSINGFITVITVIYTERDEAIRIISARKADEAERRAYYDNQKGN